MGWTRSIQSAFSSLSCISTKPKPVLLFVALFVFATMLTSYKFNNVLTYSAAGGLNTTEREASQNTKPLEVPQNNEEEEEFRHAEPQEVPLSAEAEEELRHVQPEEVLQSTEVEEELRNTMIEKKPRNINISEQQQMVNSGSSQEKNLPAMSAHLILSDKEVETGLPREKGEDVSHAHKEGSSGEKSESGDEEEDGTEEEKHKRTEDPGHEMTEEEWDSFMKSREKIYKERRERALRVCKKYGQNLRYGSYEKISKVRMLFLEDRNLMLCMNPKAGTTMWSWYLVKANQSSTQSLSERGVHTLAKEKFRDPDQWERIDNYVKVTTVRDPFVRLVSAFYNKVRNKRAARLIKKNTHTSNSSKGAITFEKFAKYLVKQFPVQASARKVFKKTANVHWLHYYTNCAACDLNYDIISKMESMPEDLRYLFRRFNLGVPKSIKFNHGKTSTEKEAIRLFKALPRNITQELYKRYRMDFLLYGYSVDKYLADS